MYFSGIGNDSSVGEFPDMDQKSFLASRASLFVQENLFDLLLELGGPLSRWMFSVPFLLQYFVSSICDWKYECPFIFWV